MYGKKKFIHLILCTEARKPLRCFSFSGLSNIKFNFSMLLVIVIGPLFLVPDFVLSFFNVLFYRFCFDVFLLQAAMVGNVEATPAPQNILHQVSRSVTFYVILLKFTLLLYGDQLLTSYLLY